MGELPRCLSALFFTWFLAGVRRETARISR